MTHSAASAALAQNARRESPAPSTRKGSVMGLVLSFRGRQPNIDPNAFVAPTATIIGDAHLSANSSVFYGACVRADAETIRVSSGTNLQDNVVLHADPGFPCTLGSGVSVGHGAVLHGCTIEDNVLVGMGATVMNGAVVGEGSLVAAGALVLEGTVIPPRSLVAGVPAKVRRELTDEELDGIQRNAAHYVELCHDHRRELESQDTVRRGQPEW